MTMNTLSSRAQRKAELGRMLLERDPETDQVTLLGPSELDLQIRQQHLEGFIAGQDPNSEQPEFIEHECWRLLLVFPDEADPTMPGVIRCTGCGMVGRFEVEYKP